MMNRWSELQKLTLEMQAKAQRIHTAQEPMPTTKDIDKMEKAFSDYQSGACSLGEARSMMGLPPIKEKE